MTARLAALRLLILLPLLLLPLLAAAQSAPVEGVDYVRIDDGRPWRPEPGTVEVAEVFAYPCHHCARFGPMLAEWSRRAGTDVRVRHVPAAYSPGDAYARAWFALEALGETRLHLRVFDAIHREGSLPGHGATVAELANFLAGEGLDAGRVRAAMTSPATDERMNAARDFAVRSAIQGTPTLIINGRWRVQARSLPDALRIAEGLVAMERAVAR